MRTNKCHLQLWIYAELKVKAGIRHLISKMSLIFTSMCAELFFSRSRKMMTPHWGCACLFWWKSQKKKSLGKQTNKQTKGLAGSHRDCLLCPVWGGVTGLSPFQGIPPTAGARAPCRHSFTQKGFVEPRGKQILELKIFVHVGLLWRPPQWQEHSFTN